MADNGGEVESNGIMASIRVGFFEDFKGADTLLLDVDHEGLKALITWLQTAASSGRKTAINQCPGAVVPSGLHVDLSRTPIATQDAATKMNAILAGY